MTTAVIENDVPHVYKGIAEVLKSLSVEKNGTLPGNMGGKSYITAVDASAETKRQFVANKLVFFPNEEVIKHDVIQFKDRLNIVVVVTGTYKIVSTVDGSFEVVSGTGDGLATGTAVASNIASTNALKNALLRTFLITEQSVEEAAKNGTPDEAAPRALANARNTPTSRPSSARETAMSTQNEDKKAIQAWIGTDEEKRSRLTKRHEELSKKGVKGDDIYRQIKEEFKVPDLKKDKA